VPRPIFAWVCPYETGRPTLAKIKFFLMSHKYCLPVCSLLLLALFLPGCGGGLAATPNPPSNPAPGVASITPNTGTTSGGTSVTITGTGFLTGATVSLGGTPATSVTLVSSTSITATTPAHAAGAVNVMVVNTDAQSGTLSGGFTYAAPKPAPTVSAITPNSGTTNGGTAVTITGTGFLAGASVNLSGTSATAVTVNSATSITAITPAHTAGAVSVVVTNTDAQSGTLTNGYTYIAPNNPAPTVAAISPVSGTINGGTAIAITGTGFLAGATVQLGGTLATGVTVVNSNAITATTAAHAAGAVSVVVTNTDAKSGTLTNGYTYATPNPAPTVTAVTPSSGPTNGGTAVTITGTGFLAGATVKLGGTSATNVAVVNGTSITAVTPAHAAGTVSVVVTNTDTKSGTLTNGFTYTAANPAPTVTAITPNSGPTNGGTGVTITGTGFLSGATVKLGGTSATSVTVVNSTSITAVTPAHAAGAVSVAVANTDTQSGALTNGFTYTASNPAPTVTAITPNSGPGNGGTAVTITGTGFLSGATVQLGGTSATGVAVVSSTSITATTPAHAAGAVSVMVTNTDAQSGTLTNGFTYTAPTGTLALTTVVSGLSNPVGMERPPGDNRFFIIEQRGTIRILENGVLQSGNFLDIQSLTNFDGQEQGLLGLAFHPNYSTNHKFYVNYTLDDGDRETIIAEYQTMPNDPNTADPNSERVLLVVNQPFTNHKGGQLVFGPDGFLYIGLGDGGSGGDPMGNGQNLSTFLGKMLRINVDPPFATGKEYGIPADNPFAGGGGLPEIYAYGLRNPWRFSFEPVTNRLFVADVGQDNWEEVDILQKGGNFGWNVMEGNHCFPPGTTTCDMTNKILPITEYPHTDGVAVIGGFVYTGTAIPSLANKYIFADLTGKIWSLTEAPANTWTRGDLLATNRTLTSFARDAAGELYVVDYNGIILKLVLQ